MQNVKLMQKLGEYIQLAGNIAGFVPEPHVQAIHNLLETLGAQLQGVHVQQAAPPAPVVHVIWPPKEAHITGSAVSIWNP